MPWIPNTQISSGGSLDFYDSADLVRFVDYEKGSDSNSGLTPHAPFKTIAAAYSNLKTVAAANYTADSGTRLGVGTLYLLPGDHDVGTGVAIDWNRPIQIFGTRSGTRSHDPQNSASRVVSSSSSATEFFSVQGASASQITRGVSFEDIAFRMDHTVNTALTSIIYAKRVGYLTVERCSFTNADGTTNVSVNAILHDDSTTSDGEGGWARIIENSVSRMALYKCTTGSTGGNFNRGRIRDNIVFYGGSLPMIHLNADIKSYLVDGNNLEGTAVAIEIGTAGVFTQFTFINNSGEDPSSGTPPNPFYNFTGSVSQALIIGGSCATPSASGYGIWIAFGANAYRNMVIGVSDLTDVSTAYKRKITETSHADKNLIIPMNAAMTTYTVTNLSTDRSYDADATTLAEIADVLGTLIADLRGRGWVK